MKQHKNTLDWLHNNEAEIVQNDVIDDHIESNTRRYGLSVPSPNFAPSSRDATMEGLDVGSINSNDIEVFISNECRAMGTTNATTRINNIVPLYGSMRERAMRCQSEEPLS